MDFRSAVFVRDSRREMMGGEMGGEGGVFRVHGGGHQMYLENARAFNLLVSNICLKRGGGVEGVSSV